MLSSDDVYAVRTLEFVERIQKIHDYDLLCNEIQKELEWFGFSFVTCMTIPGPGEGLEENLHLNTRPEDYVSHYIEKNHVLRDPIVTELNKTLDSYTWSEVKEKRKLSTQEKRIIGEARDFSVNDGLIIPIVTLSRKLSVFSPCGEAPNLSPRAKNALELIGMYSYQALKRCVLKEDSKSHHTPLTPREKEVMTWVAAGKSDDEIADILSISTTTVTAHVESSKKKLDAYKRTYAVVQALKYGEIYI